jgi:NAD-dependent deacetylase
MRERVVVFTGAGVSAESGLRTFRDSDGLWEEHRIEDVATPEAWQRDPDRVRRFYDIRRRQVREAAPNVAHRAIASLERDFDVEVITQNIDDLHERAGSSHVLHLHGEVLMARSTVDPDHRVRLEDDLPPGARCPKGGLLRPDVVWFGEDVPLLPVAAEGVSRADRLVIVGTSLQVWPAAGLVHVAPPAAEVVLIDPADVRADRPGITHLRMTASEGMTLLAGRWLEGR